MRLGLGFSVTQVRKMIGIPQPDAPANLQGSRGDGYVLLTWEAVEDAINYNVYRDGSLLETAGGITIYEDDSFGLVNGVEYAYCVTAVGVGGESEASNEVLVRPFWVAQNFTITNRSAQSLTVSWDPHAVEPETWRIQVQAAGGGWSSPLFDSASQVSPAELPGLDANNQYDVRIRAETIWAEGEWEYQNAADTLPAAPTGVLAEGDEDSITLTWDSYTAATFEVYRNTENDFSMATFLSAVGEGTYAYEDTPPLLETTYYYWIVAVATGSGFHSEASSAVSAATTAPTYERTAFLSNMGDDGTAALNSPGAAFATMEAAVAALLAAHPGEPTTIMAQTDYTADVSDGTDWTSILAPGLTLRSDDLETARDFSGVVGMGQDVMDLTLSAIRISGLLVKDPGVAFLDAGVLHLTDGAHIDWLTAAGPEGGAGSEGEAGNPGAAGSSGANGADGSPPEAGFDGESVSADGGTGWPGGDGGPGYIIMITSDGTASIGSINATGGSGGMGGNGGNGGSATGGSGGNGGNSTSPSDPENGANAGLGGAATAHGGHGGNGANGGPGGHVSYAFGLINPSLVFVDGGGGGNGGGGGSPGMATGGLGGNGGNGANGGTSGSNGTNGAAAADGGGSGSSGADGTPGSTTII